MTAVTDSVNSIMANPLQRGSLLIDTMGYEWTDNPEEAAKNPRMVLEVIDPNTGRGELKFTPEQEQASTDFMVQQFLGMVDRKEEVKSMGQVQRQDEPEWKARARDDAKKAEAAAGAWNQLYTGKTAKEKQAAADILLGTPIAKAEGLLDIDLESEPGQIILRYADSKKNRPIPYLDDSGNPISLRDFAAKGVELHGVDDVDKAFRAGGGGTTFGRIASYKGIRSKRAGEKAQAAPISVPLGAITEPSQNASVTLQGALPAGFVVTDKGGYTGNEVEVKAPNGKTYQYTSKKSTASADIIKKDLEAFIKANAPVADGDYEL